MSILKTIAPTVIAKTARTAEIEFVEVAGGNADWYPQPEIVIEEPVW